MLRADKPWNEGSDRTVIVDFFNEDGEAETPVAARYSIVDASTRAQILAPTAIADLAASVEIQVTGAQNALVNSRRSAEEHWICVWWTYGGGRIGTETYVVTIQAVHPPAAVEA